MRNGLKAYERLTGFLSLGPELGHCGGEFADGALAVRYGAGWIGENSGEG